MAMSLLELQTMLKRGGARVVDQEAPQVPVEARADVALLRRIQALAKQHQWLGQHTYRDDSDDGDLECLLVREVLLYALVLTDTAKLTPKQLAWIEALRATGSIEVYIWKPWNINEIEARLARKRGR